ncbi:MAG: hypothetical protein HY331_03975 [Chloroflexi bacterium]|nr:hypothetical protein [Chloroflexota bacterium]
MMERLRCERAAAEFTRLASQAAREVGSPELSEEEIVQAVKRTRETLYREQYGTE